jgi:hypothetical protein
MEVEVVDEEVRALMRDPVLRRLADRMVRYADPVQVQQLWRFGEPTTWFVTRMEWYWRLRHGLPPKGLEEESPLKRDASPAKAVMAVYQQKRGLIESLSAK